MRCGWHFFCRVRCGAELPKFPKMMISSLVLCIYRLNLLYLAEFPSEKQIKLPVRFNDDKNNKNVGQF